MSEVVRETDPVMLYGDRYSVYTRIDRLALLMQQVPFDTVEIDPFAPMPQGDNALHPFGRVPVLKHGALRIYETGAITRYVDCGFPGAALQPTAPRALARMDQVIGIVDSYAYVPLVRQVFSHAVFRPLMGQPARREEVEAGLKAAPTVLAALGAVVRKGLCRMATR